MRIAVVGLGAGGGESLVVPAGAIDSAFLIPSKECEGNFEMLESNLGAAIGNALRAPGSRWTLFDPTNKRLSAFNWASLVMRAQQNGSVVTLVAQRAQEAPHRWGMVGSTVESLRLDGPGAGAKAISGGQLKYKSTYERKMRAAAASSKSEKQKSIFQLPSLVAPHPGGPLESHFIKNILSSLGFSGVGRSTETDMRFNRSLNGESVVRRCLLDSGLFSPDDHRRLFRCPDGSPHPFRNIEFKKKFTPPAGGSFNVHRLKQTRKQAAACAIILAHAVTCKQHLEDGNIEAAIAHLNTAIDVGSQAQQRALALKAAEETAADKIIKADAEGKIEAANVPSLMSATKRELVGFKVGDGPEALPGNLDSASAMAYAKETGKSSKSGNWVAPEPGAYTAQALKRKTIVLTRGQGDGATDSGGAAPSTTRSILKKRGVRFEQGSSAVPGSMPFRVAGGRSATGNSATSIGRMAMQRMASDPAVDFRVVGTTMGRRAVQPPTGWAVVESTSRESASLAARAKGQVARAAPQRGKGQQLHQHDSRALGGQTTPRIGDAPQPRSAASGEATRFLLRVESEREQSGYVARGMTRHTTHGAPESGSTQRTEPPHVTSEMELERGPIVASEDSVPEPGGAHRPGESPSPTASGDSDQESDSATHSAGAKSTPGLLGSENADTAPAAHQATKGTRKQKRRRGSTSDPQHAGSGRKVRRGRRT